MEYKRHKTLLFIVEVDYEYEIVLNADWIKNDKHTEKLKLMTGTVVFDPLNVWGTGKTSEDWVAQAFEPAPQYWVEIFGNKAFWQVIDSVNNTKYEGNLYFQDELEIEWESDIPTESTEIENEINYLYNRLGK